MFPAKQFPNKHYTALCKNCQAVICKIHINNFFLFSEILINILRFSARYFMLFKQSPRFVTKNSEKHLKACFFATFFVNLPNEINFPKSSYPQYDESQNDVLTKFSSCDMIIAYRKKSAKQCFDRHQEMNTRGSREYARMSGGMIVKEKLSALKTNKPAAIWGGVAVASMISMLLYMF